MTSIGMNLQGVSYWDTEEPFIDHFKTAGWWSARNTAGADITSSLKFDADGYPINLPSTIRQLNISVGVDPKAAAPIDEYVLTYSGTATFNVGSATIVSQTPGRIVFDYTGTGQSVYLTVTGLTNSDPLNDIHVVRADQVGLFDAGEIFNPDFVAKVAQWDVVRFMDWGDTNSSDAITWTSRSQLTDMTWASGENPGGVPLEVMVELANEAHTDMWYNVPTKAGNDFVTKALTYIRDHLDPSLQVHVEYSNEVWNGSFAAYSYAQTQANALWGVDSNGDGKIDTVAHGANLYYGYRSAQIASIAHTVFGTQSDARLVDVLAGQAGSPGLLTDYILPGVVKAGVGTAANLFTDYAVAPYFGSEIGANASAADRAIVLGWARGGAAGLDAAFHELEFGGGLSSNYSLAVMATRLANAGAAATAAGLDLVTYEGGASLTDTNYATGQQAEITAFFGKLMEDPRMGTLYAALVDDVTKAGGTEFTAFTDVGTNSAYGYYGVLDSIYDTGSARYDALLAARDAGGISIVPTENADHLTATAAGGVLNGLGGNDVIAAGAGNDTIDGGAGNDLITGSSGTIVGGKLIEVDYYSGGIGADTIIGGAGNDHIYGNKSQSPLGSPDGADSISGGGGLDVIYGDDGADTIDGGDGDDHVYGRNDNDSLMGGAGNDDVEGGQGNDTASGGTGADVLHGGAGDDYLYGNDGNDQLLGELGHDILTGGAGNDTFKFAAGDTPFTTTGSNAYIVDEITDFTDGADKLALGFHVAQVLQGSSLTITAAGIWAKAALAAHAGQADVAAVTVGADTYLFYDDTGKGGALDAAIKIDHATASLFNTAATDFI